MKRTCVLLLSAATLANLWLAYRLGFSEAAIPPMTLAILCACVGYLVALQRDE